MRVSSSPVLFIASELVRAGWVLGQLGLEDTTAGRQRDAERVWQRAVEELSSRRRTETEELRRGWCLGEENDRATVSYCTR
jgi:hypothetical protein